MQTPTQHLEHLSRKLRSLHSYALAQEKTFHPAMSQVELLDKLLHDREWAWLRPLSGLIADIDAVLAFEQPPTQYDHMVAAAHTRDLLTGGGATPHREFLERYRGLLQLSPELASTHGEIKALLQSAPSEPENEAERLHHRHGWSMRCKHRRLP